MSSLTRAQHIEVSAGHVDQGQRRPRAGHCRRLWERLWERRLELGGEHLQGSSPPRVASVLAAET